MDFDPTIFAVGGVSLLTLIFGLTQFIKELFNLDGKKVTALASVLGAVLMALYQINQFIPEPYNQIYVVLVVSLAFGMSASGLYKFVAPRAPKRLN